MNDVEALRDYTGAGLMECQSTLKRASGDRFLAAGLIKYTGLAVRVIPRDGETQNEAQKRWVWDNARSHADKLREKNAL